MPKNKKAVLYSRVSTDVQTDENQLLELRVFAAKNGWVVEQEFTDQDISWVGVGVVAGVIAWLVIMFYASTQVACMTFRNCGQGDLVLFAIIGLGMLVPAWYFAKIVSFFIKIKRIR